MAVPTRSRMRAIVTSVGLAALFFFPMAGAMADAQDPAALSDYLVVAEADALQTTVTDPTLPLATELSASPYGAAARLDSLGEITANAGAPYSPFIAGSLSLGTSSLPDGAPKDPPGYVASRYPSAQHRSADNGAYKLSASSGPSESVGTVTAASAPSGGSTFEANADTKVSPDGAIVASGTSGVDLADVGGVLDIGNVSSSETLTVPQYGKPTVTGSFSMGVVTLAGKSLELQGNTLSLFGTQVPVPLSSTILPALNAALTPAGVSVAYVPTTYYYADRTMSTGFSPDGSKTLRSVISGGLDIGVTQTIPNSGVFEIHYVVGRIALSATKHAGSPERAITGGISDGRGGAAGSPPPPDTSGRPAGGSALAAATPAGQSSGATVAPGPLADQVAASSGMDTPSGRHQAGFAASAEPGPSGPAFYLILVLGAAVAVLGANAVRLLGVRSNLLSSARDSRQAS